MVHKDRLCGLRWETGSRTAVRTIGSKMAKSFGARRGRLHRLPPVVQQSRNVGANTATRSTESEDSRDSGIGWVGSSSVSDSRLYGSLRARSNDQVPLCLLRL